MPDNSQLGLIRENSDGNPRLSSFVNKVLLADYGYGLILCRLYARYLGGDLKLVSIKGCGTEAYPHLNRLSQSNEPSQ